MSLKYVPKCPIDNFPALVHIMAWRRRGDKPLSKPMMVSLRIYSSLVHGKLNWNVANCRLSKISILATKSLLGARMSCYYTLQNIWQGFAVAFYRHGLTLIPAWISNYIHYDVWDEIAYPFPNGNGCTVEVWEWMGKFIPYFTGHVITYPCCD